MFWITIFALGSYVTLHCRLRPLNILKSPAVQIQIWLISNHIKGYPKVLALILEGSYAQVPHKWAASINNFWHPAPPAYTFLTYILNLYVVGKPHLSHPACSLDTWEYWNWPKYIALFVFEV